MASALADIMTYKKNPRIFCEVQVSYLKNCQKSSFGAKLD